MAEKDVARIYSTRGVDWSDDESIRNFAKQVHANIVAAVREAEEAKARGEIREESGLSKYFRSLRDSRIAEAQRAAQQEQDQLEEVKPEGTQ